MLMVLMGAEVVQGSFCDSLEVGAGKSLMGRRGSADMRFYLQRAGRCAESKLHD